jgi:hypothetical protein
VEGRGNPRRKSEHLKRYPCPKCKADIVIDGGEERS